MEYISLYVTASSHDEALAIANSLVEDNIAACVNILDGVTSVYRWEGKIEQSSEVAIIAKTRAELFAAASARIKALHSYDCPCIVAWPIVAGEPDYLKWIGEQTK